MHKFFIYDETGYFMGQVEAQDLPTAQTCANQKWSNWSAIVNA